MVQLVVEDCWLAAAVWLQEPVAAGTGVDLDELALAAALRLLQERLVVVAVAELGLSGSVAGLG